MIHRPQVIRNDSLLLRAANRNPFVHRGLEVGLYTMLGERLRWDGATSAFVNYGNGDFRQAADRFGRSTASRAGAVASTHSPHLDHQIVWSVPSHRRPAAARPTSRGAPEAVRPDHDLAGG